MTPIVEQLQTKPFLVAILAGLIAQTLKGISFLIVERRVNYRRFVQTDGSPNMHSAAMSALTVAVGLKAGFDSLVFTLALCLLAIVMVDTWNVKRAASRHAELIVLILARLRHDEAWARRRKALSYTPIDVLSGLVLGVAVTLLLV